jgi:hypothetical protein
VVQNFVVLRPTGSDTTGGVALLRLVVRYQEAVSKTPTQRV